MRQWKTFSRTLDILRAPTSCSWSRHIARFSTKSKSYGLLLSTPEIKYFILFYLNKWTSWNWNDSIRRGSSLIMKLFITKKFGTFLIKTTFSLLFWGHWRQGLSSFLLSLGTVVYAPCLSPSELLALKGTWPCLFVSFFAGNFQALSSFSLL